MDDRDLALFPFISEASDHVGSLGFSLDRLISSRALDLARIRGKERVIQSISGEIEKTSFSGSEEGPVLSELLSYPFARILVSCIDDPFLTRRYSLAEAVAAYTLLKTRDVEFLSNFGNDFGVDARPSDSYFDINFTDYIKLASSMKDLKWKLVNRKLDHGNVRIAKEEFARLLQEVVRARIHDSLPIDVPEEICDLCAPYLDGIKEILDKRKTEYGAGDFEAVERELFPPCIAHAIANTMAGVNLAHSMRFAMTSFLLTVGMTVDDIINMFNVSPDFDVEKTRYQIEHISGSSGTTYKPPACATMKTYGNCYGEDELCKRIRHPLRYYSMKLWIKKRDEGKVKVQDKVVDPEQK
ncbi:MAG: DNA primase regulatory subunit PriL [Methanosarcinaceae archaeon]|nr:DNA primase regulatory subunit PriL [Methanosarcinaceae archaeon]MDF1534338.1 DNA primase regulatory subunit PriL [Methanosarcinaceae archaeon]